MPTTVMSNAFLVTGTETGDIVQGIVTGWPDENGPLPNSTVESANESLYTGNGYHSDTSVWFDSLATPYPTPIEVPPKLSMPEFIGRLVVLAFTFSDNTLVLYAYATTKNLRTYTNYYIVGLAVADLFTGGILPVVGIYHSYLGYWPFSEVVCTCTVFVGHVFLQATFLMTVVICFDRFRALNMPLKHLREKTMKHACFLISLAYIIPVLLWIPVIVIFPYVGLATRMRPPVCTGPYALHPPLLIFTILVMSWIPMITTILLYAFVYSAVIRKGVNKKRGIGEEASSNYKSENRTSHAASDEPRSTNYRPDGETQSQTATKAQPPDSRQDPTNDTVFSVSAGLASGLTNLAYEQTENDDNTTNHPETAQPTLKKSTSTMSQKHRHRSGVVPKRAARASTRSKRESRLASLRATRTLTYILVTMVVSALPWSVFTLWAVIDPYSLPISGRAFDLLGWLASLSSTVNPFCYAICNPHFKAAFLRILLCKRRDAASRTSERSSRGVSHNSQSVR